VVRLPPFNRLLRRRRRYTALVGVVLVLGVVALDAHAALPDHHHVRGEATLCVAALAVATLVAASLRPRSLQRACDVRGS
jgi:hypothetical protein